MKHEIEIPNLPEGVRPVGYGCPGKDELFIGSTEFVMSGPSYASWLIVSIDDGFELVKVSHGAFAVRRKPRKRVRIELDVPEDLNEDMNEDMGFLNVQYYSTKGPRGTVNFENYFSVEILEAE